MREKKTRALAAAGLLTAAAAVGSLFTFPVLGSMCAPVQHMVNVVCAVFLGPWYGVGVAATGPADLVTDGERCFVIRNGRAEMGRITGTGCQLSALTAAFVGASPHQPLEAAAAAVCAMGLAGELGWKRMGPLDGNMAYRNYLIDAIYHLTGQELEKGADYEVR